MTPAWHPRRSGRGQLPDDLQLLDVTEEQPGSRTVTIYTDDNQAGDISLTPGTYSTDQVVRWGRGDTPEFSEGSLIRITYQVAARRRLCP